MLGTIGVAVLFVVGLALASGLLVQGFRTRDPAPLLVGFALIFLGPAAVTTAVLALRYAHELPALAHELAVAAAVTSSLGVSCGALVTAFVFRRGSRLGWLATALLVTAMLACVIGAASPEASLALGHTPTAYRLGYQMLQLGTLLWVSVETLVVWRFQRRRVRLGLASPFAVHRIGLWSLASGATALGMAIGYFSTFFDLRSAGIGLELTIAAFGLVAAGALWLSFLPPARYRARVLRRAGGPAEAGPEAVPPRP